MTAKKRKQSNYFELAEHNTTHLAMFFLTYLAISVAIFYSLIPAFNWIFVDFLNGQIYNSGEQISYTLGDKHKFQTTHFLLSWGVDVFQKTPQEARYWFNPILSLIVPSMFLSGAIAFVLSSIFPRSLGLIRRKIEREIVSTIDKISLRKYGSHSSEQNTEIIESIITADLRDLRDYSSEWRISIEDLKILRKALIWKDSSFLYRTTHIMYGLQLYLRFYFTIQYANMILGLVYVGAAVLIVIIGLRGLKFIPQTEPSLVFFALGLEFSLLLTYAFTLMFGREESENEYEFSNYSNPANGNISLSEDFGNQKEVENLLKMFISSNKEKKE
jgi:hypothetical protein